MNFNSCILTLLYNKSFKLNNLFCTSKKKYFYLFVNLSLLILLSSCASSKKFTDENNSEIKAGIRSEFFPVRLLINEDLSGLDFTAGGTLKIYNEGKAIALVKRGNRVNIKSDGGKLFLSVGAQSFTSGSFRFSSENNDEVFSFNGKKYRGSILITSNGKIVNIVSLEDYLKGVLPAEMPAGKNNQNFEALKAFAVCARTYTMMKLSENKPDFDLYIDVRDQVYGGAENENQVSNRAIAETKGMVIEYQGVLASVFYYASCGGYTEDGGNVFANANKPYLTSVKDGDGPYCSIAPNFRWEEKYSKEEFIGRLVKNGLIPSTDYSLESLKVNSRFSSGRVNELEIVAALSSGENKTIKIYGNQIRSIIRTADNKSILRSTLFEVNFDGELVTISGRGYGHGVGFCQWGAIAQSQKGTGYEEILSDYFPGTVIKKLQE